MIVTNVLAPIRSKKAILKTYIDSLSHGPEIQITSMPQLNKIICGFERKKLIVIGSRPSEGKSAFGMFLAYDFAQKFKVLYISLEMTTEEAMFRVLCQHKKISNTDLYHGEIPYEIVNTFYDDLDKEKRNLIISEEIGKNWDEINKLMEDLKHDKPDIIFMDYIQCIKTNGKKMDAIEDFIRNFRIMAIENNMCVFILSQINRMNMADSKTNEPTMEGLKGTGFLEEHADKIILLHYPCKHNIEKSINDFKVIIPKNKNGMTGFVNCRIDPQHYSFRENIIVYNNEDIKSKIKRKDIEEWEE